MKKILSLVAFLMLMVSNAMAGEVFTYTLNGGKATSDPAGFFSYDTSGKFSFNSKFTGAEYDGVTYSNGLKLESSTKILFTTTKESTVTLVQSNWSDKTIKFDGKEVSNRVEGTGCFIYTITGVAPGDHTVGRGSGEAGLFLVKVEYASVYSATFQNTANWDAVHAYAWSGEGDNVVKMLGEWPGKQLTADAEGNFPVTIEGDKPEKIIFNNGSGGDGNQTADFDFKDGGVYNYDGRIIKKTNYTAYFTTDAGWKKVYAYAWNADEEPLGEWPGTAMTYADDQWEITISAEEIPTKIIFHNNEGVQTPDLDFEADKTYEFNLNTYTATFTTDAGWEDVYAWIWTGDQNLSEAAWPGDKLEAVNGVYTFTYKAFDAPEKILFNGGDGVGQTPDLAFTNGRAYTWNTKLEPLFTLEESGDAIPAGTTQEVKDAAGDVVATVTYGVEGGANFAAPAARVNEEYANFKIYTGGNGENGTATSGTVYYLKPVYAGTVTVGVWLNGDKALYIQEDGTSLEGFDGYKQAYGSGTAFTFDVKAGSTYAIYCIGSKLGFYGFDYKFDKPVVEEPAVYTVAGGFNTTVGGLDDVIFGKTWDSTIEANDMVKGENGLYTKTFEGVDLEAGTILYKVVKNHSWDNENWGFGDNNADYVVNTAGKYNITFTFNPNEKLDNGYNVTCAVADVVEPTPDDPYENVKITPANRSEVTSLSKFVIDFTAYVNAGKDVRGVWGDGIEDPYLIRDNDESTKVTALLNDMYDGTLEMEFAEQTTPGNYTLIIPAGNIEIEYEANPDLSFKYTIKGAADYTINPAEGEVESLSTFTITFNNYVVEETDEASAILLNTVTEKEVNGSVFAIDGGKAVYVSLDSEVTAAGTYQLIIMDGSLKKTIDDSFLPELAFDYTIKGTPVEMQEFSVTFNNKAKWDKVYAYTFSKDGENVTEYSGAWPGTELEENELYKQYLNMSFYQYTFEAPEAPQFIIFNNGKFGYEEGAAQTEDLVFEDEGEYENQGQTEDVEVANIAGLYDVENEGTVALTLNNAQVTYTSYDEDDYSGVCIIEDETAGILIEDGMLAQFVEAGNVYNGVLYLKAVDPYGWGLITYQLDVEDHYMENLNALMQYEEAEVEPLEVNDETIDDYMYSYSWRLAKFSNVTAHIEDSYYLSLEIDVLGNTVECYDRFYTIPEDMELNDGDKLDVTGWLYDNPYGDGVIFTPLSITKVVEEVASPYYLVGNMTNWGVDENYQLTKNTEADVEEYMITVELAADAQFKVVKAEGETLTWYPDGMGNAYGENGELTEAGEYTIYFRPNADGVEGWFNKVIYVEKVNATGINAINAEIANGAAVYNMQGVRVQSAHRGLYIVNGKKMFVK